MSSTTTRRTRQRQAPTVPMGARRVGYLVAAAINAGLLWIAHQLLDWEWPGFLTPAYDDVLPWITASLVVSVVANLWYAWDDRTWRKPLGELVTSAVGVIVSARMWQVFPFDFAGYDHDWSWAARTTIVVGIVATSIGVVASVAKLLRHTLDPDVGIGDDGIGDVGIGDDGIGDDGSGDDG
jgi:hypothetical protein